MKITSVNNELVKETAKLLQRKYREESGLFILEGEKCIDEAVSSGIEIIRIFAEEGFKGFEGFKNIEIIETTSSVLKKISSTSSAPKCAGVGKQRKAEWKKDFKKVVLLENIKDAGNLGTILRTSTAFGVDAVILYGDTVDLYNPKCVRSSVGNLWKVPVFEVKEFNELKKMCENLTPVGTLPKSDKTVWLKDFVSPEKVLIMFGAESTGLSEDLKKYAEQNITIEMTGDVESLNLSIAVGVILYQGFGNYW